MFVWPFSLFCWLSGRRTTIRVVGHRRIRIIWSLTALSAALTAVQWALYVAAAARANGDWQFQSSRYYRPVQVLETVKFAGTVMTMLYLLLPYFIKPFSSISSDLWALRVVRKLHPALGGGHSASDWTVAATKGVFFDAAKQVAGTQWLAVCVGIPITVAIFAVMTATDFAVLSRSAVSRCPEGGSLCLLANNLDVPLSGVNYSLSATLFTMVLMTPLKLWSPIAAEAMKQTGHSRMKRMLVLPKGVLAIELVLVPLFILKETQEFLPVEGLYTYCILGSVLAAIQTTLIFWALDLRIFRIFRARRVSPSSYSPVEAMASVTTGGRPRKSAWRELCTLSPESSKGSVRMFPADFGAHPLSSTSDIITGARSSKSTSDVCATAKQTMLLLINTCVWNATSEPELLGLYWSMAVVFMGRLVMLVAVFVACKDQTADFSSLEKYGTAFGLVVDAKDLKAALKSVLDGEPYQKELTTYAGSMIRMTDTLAVSYRWQSEEMQISRETRLNMSFWQMESLADAIDESTARYVWLDKLSVPQLANEFLELKQALLSRMMAIYATAGATVALRSQEEDKSRYHQRGWTLQEFCASGTLLVITQPPNQSDASRQFLDEEACSKVDAVKENIRKSMMIPSSKRLRRHTSDGERVIVADDSWTTTSFNLLEVDEENRLGALTAFEEDLVQDMRKWCQQRIAHCKPFWLYGGVQHSSDLVEAYGRFKEMNQILHTHQEEDMLRALYPLIMNCPVENQVELVQLVQQVNKATKEPEPRLTLLLSAGFLMATSRVV